MPYCRLCGTTGRDPEWLGRFEELVAMAIEDARAGVMGKREGVGRG